MIDKSKSSDTPQHGSDSGKYPEMGSSSSNTNEFKFFELVEHTIVGIVNHVIMYFYTIGKLFSDPSCVLIATEREKVISPATFVALTAFIANSSLAQWTNLSSLFFWNNPNFKSDPPIRLLFDLFPTIEFKSLLTCVFPVILAVSFIGVVLGYISEWCGFKHGHFVKDKYRIKFTDYVNGCYYAAGLGFLIVWCLAFLYQLIPDRFRFFVGVVSDAAGTKDFLPLVFVMLASIFSGITLFRICLAQKIDKKLSSYIVLAIACWIAGFLLVESESAVKDYAWKFIVDSQRRVELDAASTLSHGKNRSIVFISLENNKATIIWEIENSFEQTLRIDRNPKLQISGEDVNVVGPHRTASEWSADAAKKAADAAKKAADAAKKTDDDPKQTADIPFIEIKPGGKEYLVLSDLDLSDTKKFKEPLGNCELTLKLHVAKPNWKPDRGPIESTFVIKTESPFPSRPSSK